jgi:hypothetical protein
MNIGVADIKSSYDEWEEEGQNFSPSQKNINLKLVATCLTLTVISSRSGKAKMVEKELK